MPSKIPEKKCVACGGTGISSSGMPCHPCVVKKTINVKENTYRSVKKIIVDNKKIKTAKKCAPIKKK